MEDGTPSQCSETTQRDGVGWGWGVRMGGTHVYLQPTHVDVWQKPSQCCNYPPIRINKKKKKKTLKQPIRDEEGNLEEDQKIIWDLTEESF